MANFEGFRETAYNDAAGHCTIGYGHLLHRGGCTAANRAKRVSRAQAHKWLAQDTTPSGVPRLSCVPQAPRPYSRSLSV
ncbi:MAG: glycoside hydrolase family protein [Solirubrobacteraceae bacterium]